MSKEKIEEGRKIIKNLCKIIKELPDHEINSLFSNNTLEKTLNAILDPSKLKEFDNNILDFLLTNKNRATILSLIRYIIINKYSFKYTVNEKEGFVSPFHVQWYEDGFMFIDGSERFVGGISLYQDKIVKYAIAAGDFEKGMALGPDSLEFLTIDEIIERQKIIPPSQISDIEKPLNELYELLNNNERDERKYQEWFEKYPWILGLDYKEIQSHKKFDDANIPDFTGIRAKDNYRDIFEIKQPFLQIFRKDGNFNSNFHDAHTQAERYFLYAINNKDTLFREKRLNFVNPTCHLIVGYKLNREGKRKIREKEYLSPIKISTYDDIIEWVKNTIYLIKSFPNK